MSGRMPISTRTKVTAKPSSPSKHNVFSSKAVVLKSVPKKVHVESSALADASIEQTDEHDDALLVTAPISHSKSDHTSPQTEPVLEEKEEDQAAPLVNREESIVCIDSVSSSFDGDSFDRLDDNPAKESEDNVFHEFKEDIIEGIKEGMDELKESYVEGINDELDELKESHVEGVNEELNELKESHVEGINEGLDELKESHVEEEEEVEKVEIRVSYSEGEGNDEIEIKGSKPDVEEIAKVETTAEETIKESVEIPKEDIVEECSIGKCKTKIVIGLLVVTAISLIFLWKKREK